MGWRESASCAAARPTAAPDAGTLPVRVGAGGAGEPASLPRSWLYELRMMTCREATKEVSYAVLAESQYSR